MYFLGHLQLGLPGRNQAPLPRQKDGRRKLEWRPFLFPFGLCPSCLVVSQRCEPRLQHCPNVHSLTAWQWLLPASVAVATSR